MNVTMSIGIATAALMLAQACYAEPSIGTVTVADAVLLPDVAADKSASPDSRLNAATTDPYIAVGAKKSAPLTFSKAADGGEPDLIGFPALPATPLHGARRIPAQ